MDREQVNLQVSGSDMKRWNLFLSEKLLAKYKEMGKKRGVSAAEMARIAMEKYLQAVEKAQKATSETANVA